MALLTVSMALVLSDLVSDSVPDPGPGGSWEIGAEIGPGNQAWGDGDEVVRVTHRGGPDLLRSETRIGIDVEGNNTVYEIGSLGGAFDDGALEIGETWTKETEIGPNATVEITVVVTSVQARVVAQAELRSGRQDCGTDGLAPHVESWTQDPADLDGGSVGPATVVATLDDACAGVDTNTTPHLEYRFGTSGSFTDAGEMNLVSGTSWRGEIPEPSAGWDDKVNETLVYRLDPMEDLASNVATSDERTDEIEPASPAPSTLTYASNHTVFSGTVENMTNLQDGTDDGQAANLTENETSSGNVTSEVYGTAHSSSGASSPGNATGAPDGAHAVLPTDRDWVSVSGYNTFQGDIRSVEVALEGHYTGTANGQEDELRLSYEISGTEGATDGRFSLSDLASGSDGPAEYVNVTGDRSWTWGDISNLAVKAEYDKNGAEDDVDFEVDALWTRVVYADPGYNLSVQVNVTDVPDGSTHDLELAYDTTGETFHVQVLNATSGNWTTRGDPLGSTSRTTWAVELTPDEVDGGTVETRLVDDGADAVERDTLALDYVRVRTR